MKRTSEILPLKVLIPSDASGPIEMVVEHSVLRLGVVDRSHIRALSSRWEAPGVYLLLDRLDPEGVWGAYVGKASPGGMRQRVLTHARSRDHWYRAVLIRRDIEHPFHSGQAGWLEGHLYDLLAGSSLVRLRNGNRPQDLTVPSDDQTSMRSYIPPIFSVLNLLGHHLAPARGSHPHRRPQLTGEQRPQLQNGSQPEESATAHAGERATMLEKDPQAKKGTKNRSDIELIDLIVEGLLAPGTTLISKSRKHPGFATVNPDGTVQFNGMSYPSVSTPASMLTEYDVNGWTFWKVETPNGSVALDLLRKQVEQRRASTGPAPTG